MNQPETEGTEGVSSPSDTDGATPDASADRAPQAASEKRAARAQRITVAVVLLGLAAILLVVQVPKILVKLQLRDLRSGLVAAEPDLDQEALDALKEQGPDLLPVLIEEVAVAAPELDAYRIVLVGRLIAPMPGEKATRVLVALAEDKRAAVRANVYEQLATRADSKLCPKELAIKTLVGAALRDQEPVARGFALASLVRLGDRTALWPLIRTVRHLPPRGKHLVPVFMLSVQRALGPGVTLTPGAPKETQIRQLKEIEAAFVKQGGKIPPGEDFESVLKKQSPPAGPPATPPPGE